MSSKKTVVSLGLIIVGGAMWGINRAIEYGYARYALAISVVVSIIVVIVKGTMIYNELCREQDKDKRAVYIAKQKLIAEIAGALILGSFIVVFFHMGAEYDRHNSSLLSENYSKANRIVIEELGSAYCNSKPYREMLCENITANMNNVLWALADEDQKKLQRLIGWLEGDIHSIIGDVEAKNRPDLKSVLPILEAISLKRGWMERVYELLPFFILLVSVFAISRKVAIAAFDASTKKNPIIFFKC